MFVLYRFVSIFNEISVCGLKHGELIPWVEDNYNDKKNPSLYFGWKLFMSHVQFSSHEQYKKLLKVDHADTPKVWIISRSLFE